MNNEGVWCIFILLAGAMTLSAQQIDSPSVIQKIDDAVATRSDTVLRFTAVEHYAVYRGSDETHPAAEMTVKDTYTKGVGKSFTILSQSGSGLILRLGLKPLLDNDQQINLPGNLEKSWFESANYEMHVSPGGTAQLDGRTCYVIDIKARRKASNTIDGRMWVDARDGTLVQVDGVATASASMFTGIAHLMRRYENIDGISMAKYARAESNSVLVGRSVITIEYGDYQLQLKQAK